MSGADITFSELEQRDVPELIEKIAEIGHETDAHNRDILDRRLWDWQYRDLPGHESHVYIARHDGEIVGYYHIPVYDVLAGKRRLRIGQIQSVAVSSKMRGQGLFRRLADFAHEELKAHVDLIYTFPNVRSIHTFLKYNDYETVAPLPIFLLPLRSSEIIASRIRLFGLERLAGALIDLWGKALRKTLPASDSLASRPSFDADVLRVFKSFQNRHGLRLLRERDFLNWRYLETPKGQHFIIGLERNGTLKSVAVIKSTELFSARGLLVMDFAHDGEPADLARLLSNLPSLAGSGLPKDPAFVMVSGLASGIGELTKAGFISMPQRLVPRQLNLLVRWMRTSDGIDINDPDLWLVTLGDWDVF